MTARSTWTRDTVAGTMISAPSPRSTFEKPVRSAPLPANTRSRVVNSQFRAWS